MIQLSRRELLAGAAALGIASLPIRASAQSAAAAPKDLKITRRVIDVGGRAASVFGLLGPDEKPGLSFRSGEPFAVRLVNEGGAPTIIHWHGLTPPWLQDGVPDLALPLIADGAERSFDFPLTFGGTHWMHAHTLQEQSLLAAPLIIRGPAAAARDEQEIVILLHDFSFRSPEEILDGLKPTAASGPGMSGMTHGGPSAPSMPGMDHGSMSGMQGSIPATGGMAMAMDLNDIEYDAYLANDRTLEDPEVVRVDRDGRVRLRVINAASATAFTLDLGSVTGELVAVDGMDILPHAARFFPLGTGQRIDVRLQLPPGEGAFAMLFLREGARQRTGLILATAGAPVKKLAATGDAAGPVVSLDLEAQLRAAAPLRPQEPDRAATIGLVGDMRSYSWGLAGLERPLTIREGERVEITFENRSMMAHAMHLHGHHFQVVAIDGRRRPGAMRDTVHVPAMRSVTIAFDADNPGKWPIHCHHAYHMATGMIGLAQYEGVA